MNTQETRRTEHCHLVQNFLTVVGAAVEHRVNSHVTALPYSHPEERGKGSSYGSDLRRGPCCCCLRISCADQGGCFWGGWRAQGLASVAPPVAVLAPSCVNVRPAAHPSVSPTWHPHLGHRFWGDSGWMRYRGQRH